jgi:hypothetical protein
LRRRCCRCFSQLLFLPGTNLRFHIP